MLKFPDYRTKAKGLPDLLLYAALVEPGIVLNKDGSFLAGWEVRGLDTASSTESDLSLVSSRFNNAVKLLGSGWMLHMDAIRSAHKAYPTPEKSHFPDPVTQLIDDERRVFFSGNKCFSTSAVLTVTYKPDFQATKLAGKTQVGVAASGSLNKALSYFRNMLEELEDALSSILRMERLLEYRMPDADGFDWLQSDLLSHIQHCTTGELQPLRVPETPMYLDAIVGGETLVGGISPRLSNRYLAVLSLDGLPQESYPAMLRDLDALALEYRFSSRFICLDQYDATKEIDSYRKGWRQQVFRFLDQFFNNPNARANRDALLMAEDAETALTEVQGGYVSAGYLTSCIVLMHEDQECLQDWARDLRRTVQTLGFGCRIESINALEAWLGTHPGNSYANLRRPMVNTLNLADLLPLSSVWTGSPTSPCPFYPPNSRPLAVLMTDNSTPFWFNIHAGDLGHTLIFGPTGAGKSTLLAFIAAQFRCYENARIFAFDKGMSMFPLCFGAGGDHYNIGNAEQLAFAPLQRIDSEDERTWAEEWVASLMELQQFTVMPSHRNAIHTAMLTLAANPPHLRSLTSFYHVVQDREIKEAIQHYTVQGAMGRLLDADSDNLNLSRFMVFEIEDLMNLGDKNLVPVLTYLFRRIEKALDGSPTILVLDEAWIMLGHPVFRAKIREWLKVMRKANCAVILATQSLSDAKNSGILDVLAESCPTKIFLPNSAAEDVGQKELYTGMGLNDKQITILKTSIPKQDYYIVSPQGRRKVQLALKDKALSFVGASDKESIARIRALAAEHGPNGLAICLAARAKRTVTTKGILMKKYLLFPALMLWICATPAYAITVTCTNCSTNLVQLLDRITNVEQLTNAIKQYQEAVEQTRQQITMVQQNIEQYQNMLQNTAQLPANLVNELKGNLTRLANLSSTLRTQRGDIVALGEIFTNLFPEQALLGTLAGASPQQMEEANRRYRQDWDKWAESVDQASQATFQLSGQQLADLQRDPARLQQYMDSLLATPDGQQKAIMAGNQLSALQVQEARRRAWTIRLVPEISGIRPEQPGRIQYGCLCVKKEYSGFSFDGLY